MAIVGFAFTKIAGDRKKPAVGKIEINNNAALLEVSKLDLNLGSAKQAGLKFEFHFVSKYAPDVAEFDIRGEVLVSTDAKTATDVLKKWKKKEQLPKEMLTEVLNTIMTRSSIEALLISRELNLPPPVNLPRIRDVPQDSREYIG